MGPPPGVATGSRDPQGQVEWLEELAAADWVQQLQLRTRRRLYALAHKLAAHASWSTFETWPTWDALIEATGWARSTMAGWLRQLRITGWITTLEPGSTPQFRPMARNDVDGNRAAVYALRIPLSPGAALPLDLLEARSPQHAEDATPPPAPSSNMQHTDTVDKTWTPTVSPLGETVTNPWGSSRARAVFHNHTEKSSADTETTEALRARIDQERVGFFDDRVPASRGEMLAAATELHSQYPVCARLTPKRLRSLCRPYWAAGMTNRDILHALRYRPSATSTLPAMSVEAVISPAGWIRARLGAWRRADGTILTIHTPSGRAAAIARTHDRHGRAGAHALPPGATHLQPRHLHSTDRQREAAARTVQTNHRTELAHPPAHRRDPAADATTRITVRTELAQHQAERRRARALREQLLEQARAHTTKPTPPSDSEIPDDIARNIAQMPADGPADIRARARKRACAEREHRHTRRQR